MWLLRTALRRPFTVIVAVIGIALCSILALTRMPIDIFPNLNLPVVYVAQPFGGMSPAQLEGYLVYYYEYHFLYITGIESVESKSIQNVGLVKLTFHPGTDMSQALAQTVGYVDCARAFMPPGTVAPFIMRFDAGSVPVGYLVFSSATRSVAEIQDLALNRVRPLFATLPGVSAPPPFGGSARTIVVSVDPDRLRAYRMAPDEVIQALNTGNAIVPAGNVRTRELLGLAPINSVLRDWRSALIVVTTIPFALLTAVVALWGAGQTINIMTLGGLALAVGILVDESTVVMENIHSHLGQGQGRAVAVLEASKEVQIPRLLAMLCVLAVFVPSFFMVGVSRSLFIPLSLAVGFAMAASYLLSSSLVPVLSTWILRPHAPADEKGAPSLLARLRENLGRILEKLTRNRRIVVALYVATPLLGIVLLGPLP